MNDSLGHAAGDQVLRTVANRLLSCVRPTDIVARLGGDEFGLLCPDLVDEGVLAELCARLVGALDIPIPVAEHEVRVGVSIGAAIAADGQDGEAVVAAADGALYGAKRAGRGTWRVAGKT